MTTRLHAVKIVVPDYDAAIAFYVGKLGFDLLEDAVVSPEKRWVHVAPKGGGGGFILGKAANEAQADAIGNQTGGRVFLFLKTDDFDGDYASMLANGVTFLETPRDEPYGRVVVFADPFGNKWDLLEG